MNDINQFSILRNECYVYSKKEKNNCFVCYQDSKALHDITQVTENDTGNLYVSNLCTAKCKEALLFYDIVAVCNISGISDISFTANYFEYDIDDNFNSKLFPVIEICYEFIDSNLNLGNNVLVHCFAGISRSVSFVIYYLMKKKKITFEHAFNIVKSKRPESMPNSNFQRQLRDKLYL